MRVYSHGKQKYVELNDVDGNLTGDAGKYLKVNATEDGIECDSPAGSGDMTKAVYDPNDDGVIAAAQLDPTLATTATKLDDFGSPDDNTDLNASTTKHGLVVKATAPAAGLYNYVGITNGETVYTDKALFDATVPETQAIADAAGTAAVAARRDHKHGMPSQATMDAASVAAVAAAGFTLADAKYIVFTLPSASHTYSGFVKSCLAHENLVFGDVCFINADEEMAKAKGDAIATMPAVCMAVATINANDSGLCLFWGFVHDDTFAFAHTGGAANNVVVSAATAGLLTTTLPSGSSNVVQIMGHALATDQLFFNPNLEVIELVA
jgi:hypothetical protein